MKSLQQLNDSTQEGILTPLTKGSITVKGGANIMVSLQYFKNILSGLF